MDANLEFIYVDVGQNGRVSDGGVIDNTFFTRNYYLVISIYQRKKTMFQGLDFVFIGDEAFALRTDFLKPFPQRGLTYDVRIFHYRLCRARRVVENAFGVLASKFRIYHTTITLSPNKVECIVLATVVLHKLLRRRLGVNYVSPSLVDQEDFTRACVIPGEWRQTQTPNNAFQSLKKTKKSNQSEVAKQSRDSYVKFFTTTGQVSWQGRMVITQA